MFYTAIVIFLARDEQGEIQERKVRQDVTDDIAEGADREELVDRLYWHEVHGLPELVEVIGGDIEESTV